jgi:hypothetical protein
MPEKPQPTPRDPYEMCPFRETFLRHFTEPVHQQAIRTVGDLVCQFVYEWSFFPKHKEPLVAVELKAAVVDLRALGVFLRETVAEVSGAAENERWERALAVKAEGWGAQLAALAVEIEQAVAEPRETR